MLKRKIINTIAVILLVVLVGLDFFVSIPFWVYTVIVFAWFIITVLGSFLVRWDYHLKSFHANRNTSENFVSITFDDGPNADFTPRVLEVLKKHQAKATFFCIGKNMETHPDLINRITSEGHSVGNHTYSHSNSFGFFGTSKVVDELQRTKSLIKKLTGRETDLYRPAFGVTNPSIEKAVKKLGLKSIGWSIRSLDTTSRSDNEVLKRITSKAAKGDIILLHDTSEKSIQVLERLLVFLKQKNLKSVTIEELLNIGVYA